MPLWRWNRDADETRIDAGITQLFSRQPQSLLCDRALHSLCIISPSCYCSRAQHALSSDSQTHTNNMTMFRTSSTRSHRNMSLAHYEAWHTCQQCLMSIKGQRGYLGRGREGYRIIKNNVPWEIHWLRCHMAMHHTPSHTASTSRRAGRVRHSVYFGPYSPLRDSEMFFNWRPCSGRVLRDSKALCRHLSFPATDQHPASEGLRPLSAE